MSTMTRSDARRAYLIKAASNVVIKQAGPDAGLLAAGQINSGQELRDVLSGGLTYIRATQPGNLATAGGIGGGAYLLGSALNPLSDRSLGERVARGLTGAALAGGGAYLASNAGARRKLSLALLKHIGKVTRE